MMYCMYLWQRKYSNMTTIWFLQGNKHLFNSYSRHCCATFMRLTRYILHWNINIQLNYNPPNKTNLRSIFD